MQIVVLNGSPKGGRSITLHSVKYLQKRFPAFTPEILNIGDGIAQWEKDAVAFRSLIESVRRADAILWCFPVYYLMAPYQVKRFIERVHEEGMETAFAGKYATTLTTSVHFFDHTAHQYIHAVSEDLGMQYAPGLTAHTDDLLEADGRMSLEAFYRRFDTLASNRVPLPRVFDPLRETGVVYSPEREDGRPDFARGARLILVSDATEDDANLGAMIGMFRESIPSEIETIHLDRLRMQSGCLGCCRCMEDNRCVIEDDFTALYRDKLLPAEGLIFAGRIRDRYLSARWKRFFDRSFFKGHTPALAGKPVAWLVSGPLRQAPNLRQILEATAETGRLPLAGIVTDEESDAARLTAQLRALGLQLLQAVRDPVPPPASFYSAGGWRIIRDLVYGLRFFFRADDRYYRRHKAYDWPQDNVRQRLTDMAMRVAMRLPSFRRRVYHEAPTLMATQHSRVVAEATPAGMRGKLSENVQYPTRNIQ